MSEYKLWDFFFNTIYEKSDLYFNYHMGKISTYKVMAIFWQPQREID